VYEAIRRAVDYDTRRGVLTVAAATNEGIDLDSQQDNGCRVLPAGLRGVVAVSAVGPNRLKASYSAYGLGVVDVTAPGGEIASDKHKTDQCVLSTVPGGYERYCGRPSRSPAPPTTTSTAPAPRTATARDTRRTTASTGTAWSTRWPRSRSN
jgi:hypothetical protein